jgi:uncharacterized protein
MTFEWDDRNADQNEHKHGVTFDYATRVFLDPDAFHEEDVSADYERRWNVIGMINEQVFVVVYTYRGNEAIRLISARTAERREERKYYGHR